MFLKDTALVVDDSQQIVNIVSKMLKERLKFGRVIGLTDGKEALQLLREEHVDWVISDWEMPDVSGLELLKLVRSNPKTSDIPFILMSSRADKESLVEAVSAGVSDYITKPFSPAKLDEKLRRFIHIKERRVDVRVTPTDEYVVELYATDGKTYNAELVNISISGCLIKSPIVRDGVYLFDQLPMLLKLYEANIKMTGVVVRMEAVSDPKDKSAKFMNVAMQFGAFGDQERMVLTTFINKYRLAS